LTQQDGAAIHPDGEGQRRPRVLIAEDEPDNQVIMQTVIEAAFGADVRVAGNGLEVMSIVQSEPTDLLLLDLMMPLLDGFEVARQLKSNPATAGVPIIAVSALARPGDREDALAAGCDDFLRKPFDIDDLEQVVGSHLKT
jgi:CheY-like chemotaxis protein